MYSRVVYTHLVVKSYGRNPVASKELFAKDSKDILIIQEQINEIGQCLLKDEGNPDWKVCTAQRISPLRTLDPCICAFLKEWCGYAQTAALISEKY